MDLNLEMIRKGIYGRLNPPEKKSCCNTNQNEKIAKKIAISVVIVTNQPILVKAKISIFSKIFEEMIIVCEPKNLEFLQPSSGVTIIHTRSKNLAYKRNLGVHFATCEWVLMIDSDEELIGNLDLLRNLELNVNVYYLMTESLVGNKIINMWRFPNARLFNSKICHYEGSAHERVVGNSLVKKFIPLTIRNYSYENFTEYLKKFHFKTSKERKNFKTFFTRLAVPIFLYLFNNGIHDGIIGLKLTLFSTLYPFHVMLFGRNGYSTIPIDKIRICLQNNKAVLDKKEIVYVEGIIEKLQRREYRNKREYLENLEQISSSFIVPEVRISQ